MTKDPQGMVYQANELFDNKIKVMPLQQMRFLGIFLKETKDKDSRKVSFPIAYFARIFDIKRIDMRTLKPAIDKLLKEVVFEKKADGGASAYHLFRKADVYKDSSGSWWVDVESEEYADKYLFQYRQFFQYGVSILARLKSANQLKLYELLKRYEWEGKGENRHRKDPQEYTVEYLREQLGIEPEEYQGRDGWKNFRKRVLDSCQQAFKEHTDIAFTYERGFAGKGGKWLSVKFHVEFNEPVKQMTFEEMAFERGYTIKLKEQPICPEHKNCDKCQYKKTCYEEGELK